MKKLMAVGVMMMCGCLFAAKGSSEERIAALEEIYEARVRDAQGRIQGTSTTDRSGKTTYRDAQGRIKGTKK